MWNHESLIWIFYEKVGQLNWICLNSESSFCGAWIRCRQICLRRKGGLPILVKIVGSSSPKAKNSSNGGSLQQTWCCATLPSNFQSNNGLFRMNLFYRTTIVFSSAFWLSTAVKVSLPTGMAAEIGAKISWMRRKAQINWAFFIVFGWLFGSF